MLRPGQEPHAEKNNGLQVAKPTRLRVPTQSERIMNMFRLEQMRAREDAEFESFEDSDDFELDNDEEWVSPYEEVFHPDSADAALQDPAAPAPAVAPPPVGDSASDVPRDPS